LDQEGKDPANPRGNIFLKKGFQGTDKSAFDIFRDIFEEKEEDDYFFQAFDNFGISDNFKSAFQAFVNDDIFCNEDNGSNSFFDSYKPTFMNPDFFMSPPKFGDFENNCTTHVFSFLSTNSGEQTFSRTSSTTFQDGKFTTSTKNIYQNGKNVFENVETNEYKQNNNYNTSLKNNEIYDPIYTPKPKGSSFILIDDEVSTNASSNGTGNAKAFTGFSFEEFNKEFTIAMDEQAKLNSPSKKITKNKESLRLINKKPSKKSKN